MSELKLVKSEHFGDIEADIYCNGNDMFMTISQLADCLGYADKSGVEKIVQRNAYLKEAEFSGTDNLSVPNGKGFSKQETRVFTEDGIYEITMLSGQPKAKEFRQWIRGVLKSIRKHGMYAIDELLQNPDLLIEAATKLKEERKRNQLLEAEKNLLEQRVAEYEPKAQYVDTILNSSASLAITQIAADYGMTAYQLNKILYEEHIQHKINGQWILYKEHMSLGYTKSQTIHFNHSDGREDTRLHTQWTQKGRLLIHNILTNRGIVANMDRELERQAS